MTTQIVREETRSHHMSYSDWQQGFFYMLHPTDKRALTMAFVTYTSRGALTEMRNSSGGPPCRIDLNIHRTMSGRSTTELHLTPEFNTDALSSV